MAPGLFPVNEWPEAAVPPHHFGLETFPLASGNEFYKPAGFPHDFGGKAFRSQAFQSDPGPGGIRPDQDLQTVVQILQEGGGC